MRHTVRDAAQHCLHWILIPAIAIGMALWPTLSSGLNKLQYDPGDTLLNLYFLEHAYHHFSGVSVLSPDRYWSPEFFWPIKKTLAWSDHLLGPSVIYGIFRLVLDPFQSYVGWLISTLWLNYISIRLATRRISGQTLPVWTSVAALVTTFSPVIIQQLSHPQLLSLFLVGPLLWSCHRLINLDPDDFCLSDWILMATWLLANGFFNIYVFVYACYGVLICTVIHLIRRLRSGSRIIKSGDHLLQRTLLFAGCLTLNLTIYIPYLQTLKTFGRRPIDEILNNLPKPASWLFGNNQWLIPPPLTPGHVNPDWVYGAEQELFPGWSLCILLAAAILTAIWRRHHHDMFLSTWLWTLAALMVCSLSLHHISAWPLLSKLLPGASSLRASSRVALIIVLFAAPAIALAARQWRLTQQSSFTPIAALLALAGSFVGIWGIGLPSFSLAQWKKEMHSISNAVGKGDCDVFWYAWREQEPWRAHVIAMHVQQITGIATANGYSGHFPRENWPFTRSSGNAAYSWITSSNPGQHHQLRPQSNADKRCIVSIDNEGKASIRKYNPLDIRGDLAISVQRPARILFKNMNISISGKHGQLYLKNPSSTLPNEWILMTRDGEGIPAQRGQYKIVSASERRSDKGITVLITDRNAVQGIEYEWMIDAQTGVFQGQVMRKLPRT